MPQNPQTNDRQTMSSAPRKLPNPMRTAEFPAGLISDYIKLVDQLTLKTRKA
jgi:hypothetical protein